MRLTKTLLISAVLLMSATGMQAAGFNQNGNYLTVQLKQHQNFGPSQIRLQVVSDKIIRVQATAEQSFRNKQSLMIHPALAIEFLIVLDCIVELRPYGNHESSVHRMYAVEHRLWVWIASSLKLMTSP
jgi:hypothetical protein